ncbi:MAG: beta-N-acetylglucosaminidase domain-containing protein [Armatimonadota bacterium]
MATTLPYRGVIEGFYGPMWSHEERMHLVRHLRGWNMNLYIYAPKDDPFHRFRWDAPYPPAEMQRFSELAGEAQRQGVQFAYAISPGNSFDPGDQAHRQLLLDKLGAFIDLGCTFFPILYDDLKERFPADGAEGIRHAEKQAALMNDLTAAISARCPQARFLFCPTHYATAEKTPYLCRLHELLDPRIDTIVTGVDPDCGGICPRTFSDAGARRYFEHFGRRPFLWDNFNVCDWALNVLHWTPYSGRGAHLDELCSGIVLNPQNVYPFNLPIFGTLGDYFADPRAYDPQASFRRHLTELMGEEGAPFGLTLATWFPAEWADYLSSENLPPLDEAALAVPDERDAFLASLREIFTPLLDFADRFQLAAMDPQISARLNAFATILQWHAFNMVTFCEAVQGTPAAPPEALAELEKNLDSLEKHYFRLPASIIDYTKRLIRGLQVKIGVV